MHTLSSALYRGRVLQFGIIVTMSVVIALAYGAGLSRPLVVLAGALLFLVLVWDLRLVVPILILIIPFGPKYVMSFGNLYLATPVTILAFAAWIWRNAVRSGPFTFPASPILPALAILFIVLAVSALQNLSHLLSEQSELLRFVQFFLYSCIFAMVVQMDLCRRHIKALLVLALIAGLLQGMIGAWQWFTKPGFFVVGTFGFDHGTFAAYIIFIFMLLVGVLFEAEKPALIAGVIPALGFLLVSIVFSFSRAGYVSMLAAGIVFLLMPVSRKRKLLFAGCGIAIVVAAYLTLPKEVQLRAYSILGNLSGRDIGISFRGRLEMWKDAFEDFLDHPILGRGVWTYRLRDNFYFKVLGEAGILGFAAFLWLLYNILKQELLAVRARVEDHFVRGIAVGLLPATFACLIVFNLAGDMFGVHRFMGSFWIVLALVLKYCSAPRIADVEP